MTQLDMEHNSIFTMCMLLNTVRKPTVWVGIPHFLKLLKKGYIYLTFLYGKNGAPYTFHTSALITFILEGVPLFL